MNLVTLSLSFRADIYSTPYPLTLAESFQGDGCGANISLEKEGLVASPRKFLLRYIESLCVFLGKTPS